MKKPPTEPLRGEAAWRAAKAEIAKRNDAARAGGVARRKARDATHAEERRAAARLDASSVPQQPHR